MINKSNIGGVILAGGRGSRMRNPDKPLIRLHNRPLIDYVFENARTQVSDLVLSVNHNPQKYRFLQLPIVHDLSNKYSGPLTGIHSAMQWFDSQQPQTEISYIACFAADVPSFPMNLVGVLADALLESGSSVAFSRNEKQLQPLFSLWSLDTLPVVKEALSAGIYGPKLLMPKLNHIVVDFEQSDAGDFLNINTMDALQSAKLIIREK